MKNKILSIVLAAGLVLSMTACGGGADTAKAPAAAPPQTVEATSTGGSAEGGAAGGEAKGLEGAFAEGPILLTSGGQSADYQMIGTLLSKMDGIEYNVSNLATSADLAGNNTLIVVVGGSSKGLGAAGIDADGELARLTELLDAAKAAGTSIIIMHTGGSARRGDLSDKFITPIFAYADYAIVVTEGDQDGLMSGICSSNGIPYEGINAISDVVTVLPAAFK